MNLSHKLLLALITTAIALAAIIIMVKSNNTPNCNTDKYCTEAPA